MKLGEFINGLAIKAGVSQDSPELKTFLADPACLVELDTKIAEVINTGLMSESAALNNSKIINALVTKGRAEAYDKTDATLNEVLELLDDEDRAKIKELKFTNDRVGGLKGAIAKLKEQQKGKGTADTAVYQKQIDELNTQLKAKEAAQKEFEQNLNSKYENDSIDTELLIDLAGKNWVLPTATRKEQLFAGKIALAKVKEEAAANGYKLVRENGQTVLKTNEGLNVTDKNHNTVDLGQFIDGAVSALIAPAKQPEGNRPPGGGGNGNSNGSNMDSAKARLALAVEGMN